MRMKWDIRKVPEWMLERMEKEGYKVMWGGDWIEFSEGEKARLRLYGGGWTGMIPLEVRTKLGEIYGINGDDELVMDFSHGFIQVEWVGGKLR